jgi:hypothetical protein
VYNQSVHQSSPNSCQQTESSYVHWYKSVREFYCSTTYNLRGMYIKYIHSKDRQCEHTGILRALIEYPQGNLEEIQQKTLQSTQEEPGGHPYRKARTYATVCTRAYSTKHYTVVELCYVTQAYTTRHKLCYVTYDLCCVHRTIRHKVC